MVTDYLSALNVGSGLNTTEIIASLVNADIVMVSVKKLTQSRFMQFGCQIFYSRLIHETIRDGVR